VVLAALFGGGGITLKIIGLAAVATAAAAVLVAAAPAHADDQDDMFVKMLEQQYGITMDTDAAVDIASSGCEAPTTGVGLYQSQQALQQRYHDYSLNTIATVMSAGVLVYCPERLP
jgi:hypothetical protein